jgi:hypothetical protein
MGTYADPSLNVNSIATANFRTPGHVQLAINTSLTSPYTTSLQAKHSTLDGNAYPISLNPLGGNVGIGMTTPSAKLAVNGLGLIGGANQSAYDIGAGRIAAGGSIYSYGSMCVGNNFGDCSHATTGFVATTNTFRLGTKYFRDI